MDFCPALDFCEGGDIADESEQDDGENGMTRVRVSISLPFVNLCVKIVHSMCNGSNPQSSC
jgi:hypothetical protein